MSLAIAHLSIEAPVQPEAPEKPECPICNDVLEQGTSLVYLRCNDTATNHFMCVNCLESLQAPHCPMCRTVYAEGDFADAAESTKRAGASTVTYLVHEPPVINNEVEMDELEYQPEDEVDELEGDMPVVADDAYFEERARRIRTFELVVQIVEHVVQLQPFEATPDMLAQVDKHLLVEELDRSIAGFERDVAVHNYDRASRKRTARMVTMLMAIRDELQ